MAKNSNHAKFEQTASVVRRGGISLQYRESRRIAKYKKGQALFSQDDPCNDVWYIQSGNAKLTIVNPQGKEAVLAILGPGDFLGEGCIIGNPVRMATATAMAPLERHDH